MSATCTPCDQEFDTVLDLIEHVRTEHPRDLGFATHRGGVVSGRHAAPVPGHVRRCGDNAAYLWYFDADTQIGFEWTGCYSDPVEVSHGGFGEPIVALVTGPPSGHQNLRQYFTTAPYDVDADTVIRPFEDLCRSWLVSVSLPDRWAREPEMVEERHG